MQVPIPTTHFAEPADFAALFAPFGYAPPIVTAENLASFVPLLSAVQTKFAASQKFEKVPAGLRARLGAETHAEWDAHLKLIAPKGFRKNTLAGALVDKSPRLADQVVRVVELFARLRRVPIPVTHFRGKNDFEALLKW